MVLHNIQIHNQITRAYSVLENVLTFTSAPAAGVIIQARHIGFGGASSQSVTGFYGRTGNVQLRIQIMLQ